MVSASRPIIDSVVRGRNTFPSNAFGRSSSPNIPSEPNIVEVIDDCFDLRLAGDVLTDSASDEESLEDVEERDVMLPSLDDFGDASRSAISLPPLRFKIPTSNSARRVSLEHKSITSLQAPRFPSPVTPPRVSSVTRLPPRRSAQFPDADTPAFLPVPTETTPVCLDYHQDDRMPEVRHPELLDVGQGNALSPEFYTALRQYADTMKRSEFSRREVILGRRRLRHFYHELAGQDHLLSGEPWGRSVNYQVARKQLVSEVYGQLLRSLRSHRADSEFEARYLDERQSEHIDVGRSEAEKR